MAQATIRKAKKEDCKEIMRLIHELSEFEKLPNDVKISSSDLERDGFETDPPHFWCCVAEITTATGSKECCKGDTALPSDKENGLIVEEEGEQQTRLVGYALYYQKYSTWEGVNMYLEDIYVSPQCRQQGTGLALFTHVAKESVLLGCKQLDFEVLDWNPARKFYEKLGASDRTKTGGWLNYRLSNEALQRLVSCGT